MKYSMYSGDEFMFGLKANTMPTFGRTGGSPAQRVCLSSSVGAFRDIADLF